MPFSRLVSRHLIALTGAAVGVAGLHERKARQRAERFAAACLESLLRAIDANDKQTGAHVRRVAAYATILADAMGLDEGERRIVELTSLFHDVGKIHEALFDIVHEPRKLTAAERRAIATHPARGAEVLAPIADFYPDLANAVLSHHERWDGSGYPRRLKGRLIPRAARVVMIADTYDAITHGRRYRDGRSARQAADVILEARGTQFDPEIVDLMLFPPVFDRIKRAHRFASRLSTRLPERRNGTSKETRGPTIEIRWRTWTEPPEPVRRQLRKNELI